MFSHFATRSGPQQFGNVYATADNGCGHEEHPIGLNENSISWDIFSRRYLTSSTPAALTDTVDTSISLSGCEDL